MAVGRAVAVPKGLVEDCLTLRPSDFVSARKVGPNAGTITWRNRHGDAFASVGYALSLGDAPGVTLVYRAGGDTVFMVADLLPMAMPCGGRRWWFACPHCRQRCDRLYLPDHGRRFACRKCWNLGYRSQRDSDARVRALLRCPEYLESLRAGPAINRMNVRQLGQAMRVIRALDARWDRFERRFRRPSR